jgi:hypothetical protein
MFLSWEKKLGIRFGLKKAGSEAAGNAVLPNGKPGNCFVVLGDGKNVKTLRIVFPELDDEDIKASEVILAGVKVKKFEWREREIFIRFPEYFAPYSKEKIALVVEKITAYFAERYPDIRQCCHNCGSGEACDVYAGASALFLCEKCFYEKDEVIGKARREYEAEPTNYIRGFFGALLFAIPGVILAVVLFAFFNTIAAVSTLVCMLLARVGYQKLKGKGSPVGAFIVSLVGAIMTVAGVCAGYIAVIVQALLKEGIPLNMILTILSQIRKTSPELFSELFSELTKNIAIALLVSAVFIVINLYSMIQQWQFPNIKKAEEITG